MPPTFIKSNDVIGIHQTMVNMYNVPTYKEINPAIFSIVTYPFLFSIMYGDWGHGFILLVVALGMVFGNDKLSGDPNLRVIGQARYLFLLISVFTIFHGLLYNEFFAVAQDWFGTCY